VNRRPLGNRKSQRICSLASSSSRFVGSNTQRASSHFESRKNQSRWRFSVEGISIEVIELRHGEKLPQIAIQTTYIGARDTVENNPLVQV